MRLRWGVFVRTALANTYMNTNKLISYRFFPFAWDSWLERSEISQFFSFARKSHYPNLRTSELQFFISPCWLIMILNTQVTSSSPLPTNKMKLMSIASEAADFSSAQCFVNSVFHSLMTSLFPLCMQAARQVLQDSYHEKHREHCDDGKYSVSSAYTGCWLQSLSSAVGQWLMYYMYYLNKNKV